MALFLLSVSAGNLFTAAVNHYMVRPLTATAMDVGASTWITLKDAAGFVPGQKIDLAGANGVKVAGAEGAEQALEGTYLVRAIDGERLQLMDAVTRKPLVTSGQFDAAKATVSTYTLVGPAYFLFFAEIMAGAAVLFVFVAAFLPEATYVRADAAGEDERASVPA
jgi:POT family proton-dependent oligopeptide transporter